MTKKHSPLNYALLLLKMRDRNSEEIRVKMRQKGFAEAEIEETIKFLADKKFIDDTTFASRFIRSQINQKPQGKSALYAKLRRVHISGELAKAALDAIGPGDEAALAVEAAEKWLSRKGGLNPESKPRLLRYLAGRGFNWDIVKQAVERIENGDGDIG